MKKQHKLLSAKRVPFSPEVGKLPSIKIVAERKVDYVELDLDVDDKAMAVLAEAGWEAIRKDRDALVSYAITKALTDLVKNEKEKKVVHTTLATMTMGGGGREPRATKTTEEKIKLTRACEGRRNSCDGAL